MIMVMALKTYLHGHSIHNDNGSIYDAAAISTPRCCKLHSMPNIRKKNPYLVMHGSLFKHSSQVSPPHLGYG
jgi:hypothetical protein